MTLEDNGSKFGTLVKINSPDQIININEGFKSKLFQSGRTLLYFGLESKVLYRRRKVNHNGKIQCESSSEKIYIDTKDKPSIPIEFFDKDELEKQKNE